MIFKFIKYTQPAWQFNLSPKSTGSFASCYVDEKKIPTGFLDERYKTKSAQLADAGYRLWNKGVLLQSTSAEINQLDQLQPPALKDEYTFLRKYWGTAWTVFALMLRIFTFKNMFRELQAFFSTAKVRRINPYSEPVAVGGYENFQAALIQLNPLVAVIIPTLNRYRYLQNVLDDLEKQTYKNFEVLVFDQSDDFEEVFYEQFSLNLKVHVQKEKLLWTARNNAVKATAAEYLLFFDDDSRVQPDWIAQHLKCIDFFKADISAGVSLATSGQKIPESYNYFRWADQFDSGNAMVKRDVFKKTGLFDEQFNGQRMGDGEFGFRAYINGFKSISNPLAARVHLKAGSGGLRELGSWDGFRPKKWFAPKPIPSVVYMYRKYFPSGLYRNAMFIGIMLSNVSYKQKRSSAMLLFSIMLTIIKSPILFVQYLKSKIIAEKMLSNNYMPEILTDSKTVQVTLQ